jgi:hypothetical protein
MYEFSFAFSCVQEAAGILLENLRVYKGVVRGRINGTDEPLWMRCDEGLILDRRTIRIPALLVGVVLKLT